MFLPLNAGSLFRMKAAIETGGGWTGTDPPERARGVAPFLPWQAAVRPHNLDPVPWLHLVHEVIIQNDVHRARQLPSRRLLRHLLDGDGLMVLVDRQAKLCLQRVVFFILERRRDNSSETPLSRAEQEDFAGREGKQQWERRAGR